MMNDKQYQIRHLDSFFVMGEEVELTNYQKKNIQISEQFWKRFNLDLKKAYLTGQGNWVKYAFMEKRDEKLFYYCAIPKRPVIPEHFHCKEVKSQDYLVYNHIGAMDRLYESYGKIYQEILPNAGFSPYKKDFLHFEKYDYRFYWNREDSLIEIWVPLESKKD